MSNELSFLYDTCKKYFDSQELVSKTGIFAYNKRKVKYQKACEIIHKTRNSIATWYLIFQTWEKNVAVPILNVQNRQNVV